VENLQPATVYHYRLVATNPGGTVYGSDQTFTTGAYPASIIQEPPGGPLKATITAKTTTKPETNAQKLSRALKACARRPKKQRAACVRTAKRKFGPVRARKKA